MTGSLIGPTLSQQVEHPRQSTQNLQAGGSVFHWLINVLLSPRCWQPLGRTGGGCCIFALLSAFFMRLFPGIHASSHFADQCSLVHLLFVRLLEIKAAMVQTLLVVFLQHLLPVLPPKQQHKKTNSAATTTRWRQRDKYDSAHQWNKG